MYSDRSNRIGFCLLSLEYVNCVSFHFNKGYRGFFGLNFINAMIG